MVEWGKNYFPEGWNQKEPFGVLMHYCKINTTSSDYIIAAEFVEAMDVFREFCQRYELEDEHDIFASPDGLGTKAADGRWTMPVHSTTIFETQRLTVGEAATSQGKNSNTPI